MVTTILSRSVLVAFCLSAVSCVVGHREVSLTIPAGTHPATKGKASFGSVADARHFENKPSDPSTPSVDGDVATLSAAQLETYIGRQRNGYGAAMGDVVLAGGATVTAKARELVTEALARRGYAVGSGGATVNVKVKRFWGWFSPGMWAVTVRAQVDCDVSVGGHSFSVSGNGENVCQAATSSNWEEAYKRAFDDFLKNLEPKLASSGF